MHRFGDFELDAAGRELRQCGVSVHLEPQAFDLLVFLVEHRDRVVSKVELLDGVWGHGFLSDANLTTRIKEARRAIGDDGRRQDAIKNVRGRGYRFVASVERSDPSRSVSASVREALVGRDGELGALLDVLARSPLVTLTGSGGVGKSTLARVVAAESTQLYEDGVRFVELAPLDPGTPVLPSVAGALEIVTDGDRPEHAVASIARVNALLVLDNCEHVIDDAATLVEQVSRVNGARVRILATSQVRLGLSFEAVVAMRPLSAEHARELFAARARAVVPSWDPDAVGRDRVDALVSNLDRLPLTIEMAAARLGSMTFDELERAIAEGAPFLQVSHRAPARRHRSLESLVTWSAELLEPQPRRFFEGFSVFAGSVAAGDVGVVLAADPSTVAFDLAALVERSLLVADVGGTEARYSMFTTVRAVARRWLDASGTAENVRRRHAEHVYDVLASIDDRIRTPEEADGRRRLAGFVDEARAAHEWAQNHDPGLASEMSATLFHASYSSLWHEPVEWSRALLASHPYVSARALPGATLMAAGAAAHRGDLRFARETALAVEAVGRGRVRAGAVEVLADVALYEGDRESAEHWAEELLRLGDELGDSHASAFGTVDAALARSARDPEGALDLLARIDLATLAPTDLAWLAYARGDALSTLREPAAAAAYIEAIDLGSMVGNQFVVSVARESLATEHARAGEWRLALDAYADALRAYLRHGTYIQGWPAMRGIVELLKALGDDRGATMLAGALSNEALDVGVRIGAEQLARVRDHVERRAGSSRFAAWLDEGRALELDHAVRVAAELVDHHRHRSSGSPHAVLELPAPADGYIGT